MDFILHPENFDRMIGNGRRIKRWIQRRSDILSTAAAPLTDPDVSIVIRTRNDGRHIRRLFEDILAQDFQGAIEVIVVDTASTDDTVAYARSKGAKIISLTQAEFTYPSALNKGFKAASHPWVVTLVGHSSLTNKLFLKSLTYWVH
jgi:glycosyltransferase involved in cell wall biosynthesis